MRADAQCAPLRINVQPQRGADPDLLGHFKRNAIPALIRYEYDLKGAVSGGPEPPPPMSIAAAAEPWMSFCHARHSGSIICEISPLFVIAEQEYPVVCVIAGGYGP